MSAMNTRMTSAWTHRFTCAAGVPSSSRNVRRKVPAERDEAPEHERVHEPGQRTLLDGLSLEDDVEEEAAGAHAELIEGEGVGCRGDQLDATRHLRREGADEGQQQDPESDGLHNN